MSGWTEGATPRSLVRADCHERKGVGHAVQTEALDGQRVLPPSGAVVVACRRRAGQVSCDHTILRRGVGGPGAEGRDETRNHGCGNDGLRGDHCHPSHAKSHLFDPLECFRCPPEGRRRYRVSTETVATTPTPRPRQPTGPVPRAARVPRPTVPPSRRELHCHSTSQLQRRRPILSVPANESDSVSPQLTWDGHVRKLRRRSPLGRCGSHRVRQVPG